MSTRDDTPGLGLGILAAVMVICGIMAIKLLGPDSPARGAGPGMGTQVDLFYYSLAGGFLGGAFLLLIIFYKWG